MWVALVLAAASVAVALLQSTQVDVSTVADAVVSAAPFVFVAALIYAAPRERLVLISAFCFAVAPTIGLVRLFFRGDKYLLPGFPSDAYIGFAGLVTDLADGLRQFDWLVTVGAILALATYIGVVRSRSGWATVGLGVVIAVAQVGALFAQRPPPEIESAEQFAVSVLAQSVVIAWAYLLATAIEHRLRLISAAVTIRLALAVFGLLLTMWLNANPGPDAYYAVQPWLSAVYFLANTGFWVLLIGGALGEIRPKTSPRTEELVDSVDAASQES